MENKPKPPYYEIISAKHPVLEKAQEELTRYANDYEQRHTVLHRSYSVAVINQQHFVLSILFCCATEPGEKY